MWPGLTLIKTGNRAIVNSSPTCSESQSDYIFAVQRRLSFVEKIWDLRPARYWVLPCPPMQPIKTCGEVLH